jgi:hypothetical protein
MGKPLSKASEGGDCDIIGEREDVTKNEVKHGSGKHVFIVLEVRPEAFPTGLPMSVCWDCCNIEVNKTRGWQKRQRTVIPVCRLGRI